MRFNAPMIDVKFGEVVAHRLADLKHEHGRKFTQVAVSERVGASIGRIDVAPVVVDNDQLTRATVLAAVFTVGVVVGYILCLLVVL